MSHIHIDVEHLSFSYGKTAPVLRDLTFHAKEHEAVGIIGANGVGKSTLSGLYPGYLRPRDPDE